MYFFQKYCHTIIKKEIPKASSSEQNRNYYHIALMMIIVSINLFSNKKLKSTKADFNFYIFITIIILHY